MKLNARSISQLEAVLARHEQKNGKIDLNTLVTSNCPCAGSHCSTGCSGNKGNLW